MKKVILSILPGLIFQMSVVAQLDLVTFNSRIASANSAFNVAMTPEKKLTCSMPFFGTVSASATTGFSPSDLLTDQPDGSVKVDIPKLLTNLKPKNTIAANAEIHLFYLAFPIRSRSFVTLGINHRAAATGSFSDKFLQYLGEGNAAFVNETVTFSEEKLGLLQYNEVYGSYSYRLTKNLTVGARFKWLRGVNHFEVERWNTTIFTDENSFPAYVTQIKSDFKAMAGGLMPVLIDSLEETGFEKRYGYGLGRGYGLDFGIEYAVGSQWKLGASVNNLMGFINWKAEDGRALEFSGDGEFDFRGLQYEGDDGDTFDEKLDALETEIESTFDVRMRNEAYQTKVGKSFILSGTWFTPRKNHQISVVYGGVTDFGLLRHQAGLVYHFSPSKWFQVGAAYQWLENAPANLGFGLNVDMRGFQLHFYTNDVLSLAKQLDAHQFSGRFGVNFIFGDIKVEQPNDLLKS